MSVTAVSGRAGVTVSARVATVPVAAPAAATGRAVRHRENGNALNALNEEKSIAPQKTGATAQMAVNAAGMRETMTAAAANVVRLTTAAGATQRKTTTIASAAPATMTRSAGHQVTAINVVAATAVRTATVQDSDMRIIPAAAATAPVTEEEMAAVTVFATADVTGPATDVVTDGMTAIAMAGETGAGMVIVTDGATSATVIAGVRARPIVTAAVMRGVIISAVTAPTGIRRCVMAANITAMATDRVADTAIGARTTTSSTIVMAMIPLAGSM